MLSEIAKSGNPLAYDFPTPMEKSPNLNMSYSGLKTAVYYLVKSIEKENGHLSKQQVLDISASFERVAINALTLKIKKALTLNQYKMVLVGGGVSASSKVRSEIRRTCQNFGLKTYFSEVNRINMDNGAMIGIAGYLKALRGEFSDLNIDRDPRADLGR